MKSPSCTGHESKHYRFTSHQNKQPRIRPTVHSKISGESPTKKFYTQSPSSALGCHFFATFSESLYFECISPFLIHLIHSSPVIFWCLWGNALNLACHARDNALCAVAAWKDCLTCWRRMARIRGGAQYCMKMEAGPTTTKFQAKHCLFTRLYCVCTESQIESGNWKTMQIHCLQKEPQYQNLRISRIMTWFRSTGRCFAISWSKIWFHLNDQKPSPSSHLSVHLDVQVTNALVVPLVLPEDRLATVQLGQWRWGQWKKPVWNLANRMGATT